MNIVQNIPNTRFVFENVTNISSALCPQQEENKNIIVAGSSYGQVLRVSMQHYARLSGRRR